MPATPQSVLLDPPRATQEAFTINVNSTGEDPLGQLRLTSQVEANAWGTFLTVGAAIATLYDLLLKHIVTIQLPAGIWNLTAGELDQMWRANPTVTGRIRIAGDPGWEQLAGTSQVTGVSSDLLGNVVLSSDPAPAVDAKGTYLYVVSGAGAGQYKPIRTHSGTAMTIGGAFSPSLSSSIVQVSKPPTLLVFGEAIPDFKGKPESVQSPLVEFYHLVLETTVPNAWLASQNIAIQFDGGLIFNNIGAFFFFASTIFGDVIFDVRTYAYTAIDIRGGIAAALGTGKVLFLLGASSYPAVLLVGVTGGYMQFGVVSAFYSENWLTVDGWTGSYIKVSGYGSYVTVYTLESYRLRSDQLGSEALSVIDGGFAWMGDFTRLSNSTFKGATVDALLDGNIISWAEVAVDPDKSMRSHLDSYLMEKR